MLNRREFLEAALILSAAGLLPAEIASKTLRKKIIVVGAGLAGLSAACELSDAGHDVTVLEASMRAGGRVCTIRHPFADGLYAEVGGEWINEQHHYVRKFAKRFGLALKRGYGFTRSRVDGELVLNSEASRRIDGVAAMNQLLRDRLENVNPFEPATKSKAKDLDKIDFRTFLNSLNVTPAAIEFMSSYVNNLMTVRLDEISALHIAYEFRLPQNEDLEESRITGGNDRLPLAMAHKLQDRIHYAAPVSGVEWNEQGTSVTFHQSGETSTLQADRVIFAIPAKCLTRVQFTPSLPKEASVAVQQCGYGRAMKTVLQCRRRFWSGGPNAAEFISGIKDVGDFYHSSQHQTGPRGLLTCYSGGSNADALAKFEQDDRMERVYDAAEEAWPGSKRMLEGAYSRFWNEERWTRGSYAFFAPGQMSTVRDWLRVAVGPIHFAGEHTSDWQGYMNGAIESGVRAASEIEPSVKTRWLSL